MNLRVLGSEDIIRAIDLNKVMDTVEQVYVAKARGNTVVWPTVFYDFKTGEKDMDIKSGYLKENEIHGLKVINWTVANEEKGLPSLIGLILVFDTETGMPLGLLDGSVITGLRTGCAGAIGAKYLAREGADTLFVLGAGNQAFYQIAAFLRQFPQMKKIYVADPINSQKAVNFTADIKDRLKRELKVNGDAVEFLPVSGEKEMAEAVGSSSMVVTVTPSRKPLIQREWVRPGTHFSCIGSDMSGKEEIDPQLFRGARIYGDDLEHCVEVGEMEIPLKTGVISREDIVGEIGELILREKPGRQNAEEITIYDATGMALLDIAAAKTALDSAEKEQFGQIVQI